MQAYLGGRFGHRSSINEQGAVIEYEFEANESLFRRDGYESD